MYVIASSASLVLCVSFLVGTIHRCVEITIYLTPAAHNALEDSPVVTGPAKVHQLIDLQRTVLSIWISLIALDCVSLPLSWIEEFLWFPGVDSSRLLIEMQGFEVAVLVLDVMLIVVTTTFQPGDNSVLLSVFMLPIIAGVGSIYIRLPRRLVAVAASKVEPNEGLQQLTLILKRTRALVWFGTFVTLLGGGSNAFTISTYRTFDKPGDISLGWLSFAVVLAGLELLLLSILFYVWQIKKGSEASRIDIEGNHAHVDLNDSNQ